MATHFNTNYTLDKTPPSSPLQTGTAPELLDLQRLINKVSEATSSPPSESSSQRKSRKRVEFDESSPRPESDGKVKKTLSDTEFKAPEAKGPLSPQRVLSKHSTTSKLVAPQTMKNWGSTNNSDPIPPTPMKKKVAPSFGNMVPKTVEVSPFKINQDRLSTGKFQIEFTVIEIDSGSYASVYEIQHIPGVVLKAFHGIKMGFKEAHLTDCLKQMQINYKDVVALGLPVATVLNVDQLLEHKYILQERIPHELDRTNQDQMQQVQKFFAASIKHQVMMDLQPQNLRVKDDGTVVLIDFVEEEDDVSSFMIKACKEWIAGCTSKEEAEKLLTFLTAGHYDKTWINEVLGGADSPKKHGIGARGTLKL